MMLTVDDFPLKVIGNLVYARMRSSPVLTADTPQVALQITAALNGLADTQRPMPCTNPNWLVRH